MKQITFASSTMPRLHFIQQWFDLSDLAMEEAFHDTPLLSKEGNNLATQLLAAINAKLIDRGLLPKAGAVVDASCIAETCSTKNDLEVRAPEMHQTKKGRQL